MYQASSQEKHFFKSKLLMRKRKMLRFLSDLRLNIYRNLVCRPKFCAHNPFFIVKCSSFNISSYADCRKQNERTHIFHANTHPHWNSFYLLVFCVSFSHHVVCMCVPCFTSLSHKPAAWIRIEYTECAEPYYCLSSILATLSSFYLRCTIGVIFIA